MPTILDSARQYISRGWCPIPIPHREKGPKIKEWNKLRLTAETAAEHFNGRPQNLGIILGEPSHWLVDVDLDCEEARAIAPRVLTATARFGRAGSPNSHWLYHAPGAESCRYALRTPDGQTHTLLELRSTNLQTVFPPSTHPSNEPIRWDLDVHPTEISAEDLSDTVLEAAVRCAFARFAPEALSGDAPTADGYPIDRLPDGIREQVQAWLGQAEAQPEPERKIPVRSHTTLIEAVRRYNSDHQQEYPRSGGACPACGHKDCFGRFPDDPQRWACFSAAHSGAGIQGSTCWHGDQLDLDAHAAGKTRAALLREVGYLLDRAAPPSDAPASMDDELPPSPPPIEDEPEEPVFQREAITVAKGEGHRAVTMALPLLAERCSIYCRGGQLVGVSVRHNLSDGVRRAGEAPAIIQISYGRIWEMLSEAIEWRKFDGRSNDVVRCDPPPQIVQSILQRGDWPGIPELRGIATTPILREDGSVCATPGFDSDTGLYYVPRCRLADMPARPTLDDARAACAELLDVVCDFPFASPSARSVWLSSVLARIGWYAFTGGSPLILIDSSTPGIGKTRIADASSIISTGAATAKSPWVRDEDEFRKRMFAHLVAGDQIAMIDNVPGGTTISGSSIEGMLTSERWTDRDLGRSRNIQVPMDTLWMVTGNNIAAVGETARRTLNLRLECSFEHPEKRDGFRHDPLIPWIQHERPRLLCAALTVLRAFMHAGKPNPGISTFGSFEGWSDLVRAAIVWTGEADPADSVASGADAIDELALAHCNLLAGVAQLDPGGAGVRTADILDALAHETMGEHHRLRDALDVLCPAKNPRDGYNSRSLGKTLRSLVDRVRTVDGNQMRLTCRPYGHGLKWVSRPVKP